MFTHYTDEADDIIGHFNYILVSDGDLQEPISTGAAALAGHWGLSRVIIFYDSNKAQISGNTQRSDSADYGTIFEGYGPRVGKVEVHVAKWPKTAQDLYRKYIGNIWKHYDHIDVLGKIYYMKS